MRSNLARVEEAIRSACRRAGRSRGDVHLMAVSKMHPAAVITEAAALGVTLFGENKVQEFEEKYSELAPLLATEPVRVHLIGHLQSNKAARAAEIFSSVDTLDSLRLALRLDAAAAKIDRTLPVLLEIKLSDEESKSGLAPDSAELQQLLERLPDLPHLQLRGLMTVPPYLRNAEAVRPYFRRLRELRDALAQRHPRLPFDTLSMGMSHDFAVAIEEGSTEVRIGTAIFGARDYGT
ncbi:MAG: YggS family pyridoxal phosphate-dependent enzyme [Acidobacteriaceae bacterium]